MKQDMIVILDLGSHENTVVARAVRALGVYSEIHPHDITAAELKALLADNWNWFPFPELTTPIRVTAKARSRMTEQPATVYPEENGAARVVFDAPQRALTPGQAVVLYDGDMVVGGGTITKVL